jgi:leucyl-tRNA synthetase
VLPDNVKFGEGNPLLTNTDFVNCKCHNCGGPARRETDTMDTFFDSSWYFLRYADNLNSKEPFDASLVKYFMPVDQYIGGAEHACMHLIYARFFVKALRDMKMLSFDEPFLSLFNQGMLHGSDGNKMSKSLGNVVNPIEMIEKYSADSLRFNLMSLASPDKDSIWNDRGMDSAFKQVSKIFSYFETVKFGTSSKKLESKVHKTIKLVSFDIENFKYNLAIIKLRELFEHFEKEKEISTQNAETFLRLLHPICPHMTEELWQRFGHKKIISLQSWPTYDATKIDDKAEALDDMIDSTKQDIRTVLELAKISKPSKIILFISEDWKYVFFNKFKKITEETHDFKEILKLLLQDEILKKHMQDISKLIPSLLKDQSRIPNIVTSSNEEADALLMAKSIISLEFCCSVEVILAKDSNLPKAKQATPGKSAILIE